MTQCREPTGQTPEPFGGLAPAAEAALATATRMSSEGRSDLALEQVLGVLEADSECYDALVFVAEEYTAFAPGLGREYAEGARRALPFHDRAIALRPDDPDAYDGRAMALNALGDHAGALECAERGLAALGSSPVSPYPEAVWRAAGEGLYRQTAAALVGLGRLDEARAAVDEGLRRFPDSDFIAGLGTRRAGGAGSSEQVA